MVSRKGDIDAKASTLLKIGNAEIQGTAQRTVVDLFSKYPNADRVAVINTLLSVTCSLIRNSTQMSDADKLNRWMAVYPEVLSLMPSKSGMIEDPDEVLSIIDVNKSRGYLGQKLGPPVYNNSDYPDKITEAGYK